MNKELFKKVNLFTKKFNLEKYLNDKGIEYKYIENVSNGDQLRLEVCPFCKSINYKGNYHPWRFNVNCSNKLFICFNCNKKGNLLYFLTQVENLNIEQVLEKFLYNIDIEDVLPLDLKILIMEEESPPSSFISGELLLPPVVLPFYFENMVPFDCKFEQAYRYLELRGCLDRDIINQFDIRYSLNMKRIIFPIYFNNEVIGWQGRDITGDNEPKYLISKGLQKQRILYNYDKVKDKDYITIVEGIMDVIKCSKINPVCLFGKNLSDNQIKLLLNFKHLKRIYVCLDPEEVKATQIIVDKLSPFYQVLRIELPLDTDPGDYTIEQMIEHKEKAIKCDLNSLKIIV